MDEPKFSRGVRVTYTGNTCPGNKGRTGWVTGYSRDGWVRVKFDGDHDTTKCCGFNLTRVQRVTKRRA